MNVHDKQKDLLKNTGILSIGTLLSKLLTFFLLPLYTHFLTTENFGKVDLLQTVAYLLIPIISFEMFSGIFRFIIEKKDREEKSKTITTALFAQSISVIVFVIVSILYKLVFGFDDLLIFIIYFISLILLNNIQFIVRGFGNNVLFSLMNFINTLISLILNIVFIVFLRFSGISILYAFTISNFVTIIIPIIKLNIFSYVKPKYFSYKEFKDLFKYSFPLITNEVSWWIANTSDRLLISWFINVGANGIYAVANKIPTIYTTIFKVFNLAWVESISRGIKDDNSSLFIKDMYKKCINLFGCICIGIICCMSLFFKYIIDVKYSAAYIHILILMIAIFFNSLDSLIGSILTGYKETKVIGYTTVVGAVVNIIVNLIFIKKFGLYAASISTLVSYIVIFIVRSKKVNKCIKLEYSSKSIFMLIINLCVVSYGYMMKNAFLNIVILIYLVIYSVITNLEFLMTFTKRRKKSNG